ncbi:hypothetical protein [Nonomuraea roseola]|uniref:Uncharacterized protein n=1 Tax=Nonomuraea roseola TaxID=46179 RepID=A0ABV5Q812_9ACTN
MAYRFAQDEKFNFEIQLALGQVQAGAGDVGEILSTTARVIDGDAESWFTEWTRTGERVHWPRRARPAATPTGSGCSPPSSTSCAPAPRSTPTGSC